MEAPKGHRKKVFLLSRSPRYRKICPYVPSGRQIIKVIETGTCGINVGIREWMRSFFTGRVQFTHRRSQGSVLGMTLFGMYVSPVGDVITQHNVSYHDIWTFCNFVSSPSGRFAPKTFRLLVNNQLSK